MKPYEAGRELDALIAEKVMDQPAECTLVGDGVADPLRLDPVNGVWRLRSAMDFYWERWAPDGAGRVVNDFAVLPYSTDISAAWEAVRAMARHGFLVKLHVHSDGAWAGFLHYETPADQVAEGRAFVDPREVSDRATPEDAVPLAICRAALAAMGVE